MQTQLAAGRQLDAEIAEKVMGYAMTAVARSDSESIGLDFESEDWQVLPHYSTDIAAAWAVATKLGLTVIPVEEWWQAGRSSGTVLFRKSEADTGGELFIEDFRMANPAVALTAPLAICLAALATLA